MYVNVSHGLVYCINNLYIYTPLDMLMCIYIYTYTYTYGVRGVSTTYNNVSIKRSITFGTEYYGVATVSRPLKIIGLFCRISSLVLGSFAKETYNFKEPTNRSHPILV